MSLLGSIASAAAAPLIGAVASLGSTALANSQSEQNAASAFANSQVATAEQFKRTKYLGRVQYNRTKALAKTAYRRNIDTYNKRYQRSVVDLRKAGLNPILAVSGGFNPGSANVQQAALPSTPSVSSAQSFKADLPTYYNPSSSAYDMARTQTEEDKQQNLIADTSKKLNESKESVQRAFESMERVFKIRQEKKNLIAGEKETFQKILNLKEDLLRIGSEITKNGFAMKELESRSSLQTAQAALIPDQSKQIQEQIKIMALKQDQLKALMPRMQNFSKIYDSGLGIGLQTIESFLGSIGALLNGLKIQTFNNNR